MNSFRQLLKCDRKEVVSTVKLISSLGVAYSLHYIIPLISLLYSGHKNKDYLASIGLGISFGNAFGFTMVFGIDRACQTLASQAHGAHNLRRVGVILQRSIVILFVVSLPILSLWLNAEKIFLGLRQDKKVARIAGEFLTWYVPVIWVFGIFRFQNSYLACQGKTQPQIIAGIFSCGSSILANYILSIRYDSGIPGYAVSTIYAYLVGCFFLTIYIKVYIDDWPGWSVECLDQWWQFMCLAIPGILKELLDWGTSEVGIIAMGLLGKVTLAAMLAGFNIVTFLIQILQGFSAAACVKVGNCLGRGDVDTARQCAFLISLFGVLLTTIDAIVLLAIKGYLGYIFSSDKSVIDLLSKINILLAMDHFIDANGFVLSGVLNGLGLQKYVTIIVFIGYNIIGLSLSIILAFPVKWKLTGYWVGQQTGGFVVLVATLVVIMKSNWHEASELAIKRAKTAPASNEKACLMKNEEMDHSHEDMIELGPKITNSKVRAEETTCDNSLFSKVGRNCFVTLAIVLFMVGIVTRVILE